MSEKKKTKRRGRAGRAIKKWIKRLILLAIVLAAALFGLKAYIHNQAASTEEAESYSQTQVMRGAIEETVYGTGTTSARSQPNLLAEADGTLTELRVSIGDAVKEGDILAVLTNEEIDAMSRDEIYEAVLGYEGLINYGDWIKELVLQVYGIDLNNWPEYLAPETVAEMKGLEEY